MGTPSSSWSSWSSWSWSSWKWSSWSSCDDGQGRQGRRRRRRRRRILGDVVPPRQSIRSLVAIVVALAFFASVLVAMIQFHADKDGRLSSLERDGRRLSQDQEEHRQYQVVLEKEEEEEEQQQQEPLEDLEEGIRSIRSIRSIRHDEHDEQDEPEEEEKRRRRRRRLSSTSSERPVMYTFYHEYNAIATGGTGMDTKADRELLDAWSKEWYRAGWNPRVLSLDDARLHPLFGTVNAFLDGLPFKYYDRLCFLRWFAMAQVGGGWMSDYDTFPLGFVVDVSSPLPNGGAMTIHEHSNPGGVPSLVSGSDTEYGRFSWAFVENARLHRKSDHWSDMKSMQDLYQRSYGLAYHVTKNVLPALSVLDGNGYTDHACNKAKRAIAIHFSHYSIDHGKLPPDMEGMGVRQRGRIASKWIQGWKKNCRDVPSIPPTYEDVPFVPVPLAPLYEDPSSPEEDENEEEEEEEESLHQEGEEVELDYGEAARNPTMQENMPNQQESTTMQQEPSDQPGDWNTEGMQYQEQQQPPPPPPPPMQGPQMDQFEPPPPSSSEEEQANDFSAQSPPPPPPPDMTTTQGQEQQPPQQQQQQYRGDVRMGEEELLAVLSQLRDPVADARGAEPIIYTFYEAAETDHTGMTLEDDRRLLGSWALTWKENGWDPRILTTDVARQHPEFQEYDALLDDLPVRNFDRYCFHRWFAMVVMGGGWMSDFDTYPLDRIAFRGGGDPTFLPKGGQLTVHEFSKLGGVPSLVSGNQAEYYRMAKGQIETARQHASEAHWSDMMGIQDLSAQSHGFFYQNEENVVVADDLLRDGKVLDGPLCEWLRAKYAVHFSRQAMLRSGLFRDDTDAARHRYAVARSWILDYRTTCLQPDESGNDNNNNHRLF